MAVARAYETETVDCPRCGGDGQIEWDDPDDPGFQMPFAPCAYCHTTGQVDVCARCHDSGDPCGACRA